MFSWCPPHSGSHSPSSPSNCGFPGLQLILGCGSLLMLPSAAGWSLSDDDCLGTILWVWKNFIRSHLIDFLAAAFGPVLVLWSNPGKPDINRIGPPLVMWPSSLRIGGPLHKFCATITPTHLVERTDCRLEVIWLCYRRWPLRVHIPITRRLWKVTVIDSRELLLL